MAENESKSERLHVRIAHSGLCSRRAAERLIEEGRVEVNGEIVMEKGFHVTAEDRVDVDGRPIAAPKSVTIMLNKPRGYITTLNDPQGRPTIVKFLPNVGVQLKPVGRLDMDTEGLLLATSDGELAHRLTHPRYGVEKEYMAVVQGVPTAEALERLRRGVPIGDGARSGPARVELVHADERKQTTGLRITIHEGKKRQVRLMCQAIGHPVITLRRERVGPLRLRHLRAGEARLVSQQEMKQLRKAVGLE